LPNQEEPLLESCGLTGKRLKQLLALAKRHPVLSAIFTCRLLSGENGEKQVFGRGKAQELTHQFKGHQKGEGVRA